MKEVTATDEAVTIDVNATSTSLRADLEAMLKAMAPLVLDWAVDVVEKALNVFIVVPVKKHQLKPLLYKALRNELERVEKEGEE